jgi:hypothetical protein
MPNLPLTRRNLFISSAALLAAPAILTRASFAQTAPEDVMKSLPVTKIFQMG